MRLWLLHGARAMRKRHDRKAEVGCALARSDDLSAEGRFDLHAGASRAYLHDGAKCPLKGQVEPTVCHLAQMDCASTLD